MKNSLKKALSLVALGAVAVSAASMNAFAEGEESRFRADGGFSAEEIANSALKPTITATQKVIKIEDAKNAQTIDITVTGANAKYAATGFHIYYDNRLEIGKDPFGGPKVSKGAGAEYLSTKTPDADPTAVDYDKNMKGVFVCSSADGDKGLDGVMWTFDVTLPADAKEGDVFPIDIVYRSNKTNEDLFVNVTKNAEGRLMQAYTFTQGTYNPTYNNNFTASEADVKACAALASINGGYDGYIAIADGEKPTEPPTAEPTEPPTEPQTVESTAASTVASTAASTDASTVASDTATTVSTSKTTASTKKSTASTKKNDKSTTTGKKDDSPKTGVAGVGVAVAGLAVALGTAFVLRKKED